MNLTVRKNNFDEIIAWMRSFDDECKKIKSLFDVNEIYFEDYINYPKSDWFSPHSVLIQNAKEVTTIDNIDEVQEWMTDAEIINNAK